MLIFNEFELTLPEGFHEMTEDEKRSLNFWGGKDGVCISDPERHIVVSFGAKAVGFLMGKLVRETEVADRMESALSKAMNDYGYAYEGAVERTVCGKKASGFTYTYTAKEIPMTGESLVVKSGKTLLYIHYYTRTALRDENLPVWEKLLSDTIETV